MARATPLATVQPGTPPAASVGWAIRDPGEFRSAPPWARA